MGLHPNEGTVNGFGIMVIECALCVAVRIAWGQQLSISMRGKGTAMSLIGRTKSFASSSLLSFADQFSYAVLDHYN